MYAVALLSPKFFRRFTYFRVISRKLCNRVYNGDGHENGFGRIEDFLNESWKSSDVEHKVEEKGDTFGSWGINDDSSRNFSSRQSFINETKYGAERILAILHQDGPGLDAKAVLNGLAVRVSGLLVREVLFSILKMINSANKNRCAKLGYKFFVWSGEQENYRHTENAYHLMMKIFAECGELKAMWRLVEEMIEKGYPMTARTFNIVICSCREAGIARTVIERFIKSKVFNYRQVKDSFNAILRSLLILNQYKLVEWVYQQMLAAGHCPNALTYNIIMCAKFRLGKLDEFHGLLAEMGRCGLSPDIHTFNILLHVLGKGDKPVAALKLLNHMKDVGIDPSVLHYTTLIDGLSRAGNLEASQYFFDEMVRHGCTPDVVSYTVMITGFVAGGQIDKAQAMFAEMIDKGQLPNVFTYNSMIRGLCLIGKFEEAWLMLKEMDSKGCNPNFLVYTTLVGYLRNAGKLSKAHEVIRHMMEKGRYTHLVSKIKNYRRC
ncbi:pentatricopeptide repeat-containing protein At3g60050-like [Andrographis paniculata]|uniref:pentatricopeptide repeat-containing protein At3g60050-like n=1 Tax=Andrographis paniculata TaxID=175694 RepID=UPI0021E97ED5|nr:pentatricopeptide repeat-containing protein At3g60050-like [Andrographis paniculata]